jgi:hypothetical protein
VKARKLPGKLPTDAELIETMISRYSDILTEKQLEAFTSMRGQLTPLTERQSHWVRGVAERLGIEIAPAENIFSTMDESEQREHLTRAAKVVLPWEQPGYVKALKPPGKQSKG